MASSKLMNNLAYVDGAWVKALSGKTFDVFNPTTAEKIASVPDMDDKDTDKAIEAAAKVHIHVLDSFSFLSLVLTQGKLYCQRSAVTDCLSSGRL